MLKQTVISRSALAFVLMLSLLCPSTFAQGTGNRGDRKENNFRNSRGDNRGDRRENNFGNRRGDRYHYRDGRWYRRSWFGWEFAVSALVIGALVESLPPRHTTVVVDNTTYYFDDNVYYKQLPDGSYVVVQPPVMVSPQIQSSEVLTINIPNSRGGYTAVNLRRSGGGFVGPQGEYYPDIPSVEQLKAMYGK